MGVGSAYGGTEINGVEVGVAEGSVGVGFRNVTGHSKKSVS